MPLYLKHAETTTTTNANGFINLTDLFGFIYTEELIFSVFAISTSYPYGLSCIFTQVFSSGSGSGNADKTWIRVTTSDFNTVIKNALVTVYIWYFSINP